MVKQLEVFPVGYIFNPKWWNKNYGVCFDRDFFFDPKRRVNDEQIMRRALYDRFGDIGLGEKDSPKKPVIGAVHLAAGYFISNLLGCDVRFYEDSPPDVIPANMQTKDVMKLTVPDFDTNPLILELKGMMDKLYDEFGYLQGDINWSGILNIALDLRGQELFIDFFEDPDTAFHLFDVISKTLVKFVKMIRERTGSSSISVNPFVRDFDPGINLHSNCSLTMISAQDYETHLLRFEQYLADHLQPYGIHYCGKDMEKAAESFAKIKEAGYFDVGWGSDIAYCRKYLPDKFFNLRLNPARMLTASPDEVIDDVNRLVLANGGVENAGVCCINMDHGTPDENIRAVYKAAESNKPV